MNRRGDMPTILLFVIALVLVLVTLFAFITFSGDFGGKSKDLGIMMSEISFAHDYVFAKAEFIAEKAIEQGGTKEKFIEITAAEDEKFRYDSIGNFYGKIRNGDFEFQEEEPGNYVLEIKGLFVKSEKEGNSIKRNFNLKDSYTEAKDL